MISCSMSWTPLKRNSRNSLSDDSPTRRVGSDIIDEFVQYEHKYPMLSLGNTYSEEELRDFDDRIKKGHHRTV